MTDNQEVWGWIRQGKGMQCTHILVVRRREAVDQHYPIFVRQGDDLSAKIASVNGVQNQVIDEVIPLDKF